MAALDDLDGLLDVCLSQARTLLSPKDLETPYTQYGNSNFVPAALDITHIDTILLQRHSQLADISYQLSLVQSALHKLETLRTRLEDSVSHVRHSIHSHRALKSPIRRFPPEILGEIFYHCLSTQKYVLPGDVGDPTVLTHVCRYWRIVAVSTPYLWSSITLHLDKAMHKKYRSMCATWLSRAKDVPLAIRVLNILDTTAPLMLACIVDWLRPLLARCHDVSWHGPRPANLLDICFDVNAGDHSLLALPMPTARLCRLHVGFHGGTEFSVRLPGPAPRLHVVSLSSIFHYLQSPEGITLPWTQLTELHLTFPQINGAVLLDFLALCPSLRVLTASCIRFNPEQVAMLRALGIGAVYHQSLRRLGVRVVPTGLDAILSVLTMPALEELDVSQCHDDSKSWPHGHFLNFMERSGNALERLVVWRKGGALKHLSEYKALMPRLAVLAR